MSSSGKNTGWEIVDTKKESADPTPQKINLHTLAAIRREMAAVYRDMRADRIEKQDGTRLIYALDRLREAMKEEILDQRIAVVEQVLRIRKGQ